MKFRRTLTTSAATVAAAAGLTVVAAPSASAVNFDWSSASSANITAWVVLAQSGSGTMSFHSDIARLCDRKYLAASTVYIGQTGKVISRKNQVFNGSRSFTTGEVAYKTFARGTNVCLRTAVSKYSDSQSFPVLESVTKCRVAR